MNVSPIKCSYILLLLGVEILRLSDRKSSGKRMQAGASTRLLYWPIVAPTKRLGVCILDRFISLHNTRTCKVPLSTFSSLWPLLKMSAQTEGLCLRYPENLGLHPTMTHEMAANLLIRALSLSQTTPFHWGYIDRPQGMFSSIGICA